MRVLRFCDICALIFSFSSRANTFIVTKRRQAFHVFSSIGFATPLLGEAHADVSSGAVEIYGTANATYAFLDLSYLYEECGMPFPIPFELGMDNTTAEAFCNDTVKRSKLKHIDCRQEWVKLLRNKNVMKAKHVDTNLNLADLFTKILPARQFQCLRDQMMAMCVRPLSSS